LNVPPDPLLDVFPGDSAMSRLMRAHDWSSTPLGPPERWPQGLKTPLGIMLTSRFEMWMGWGEDLAFFYNDAYAPTLGAKHPDALGKPMREVWAEVFLAISDRVRSVMQDGVATWDKALLLFLERNGYLEETYHTFSYSPLRGDDGAIEGLMCVVTEETERVISERRLRTLQTLAAALLPARTREDIAVAVRGALADNPQDFPFGALQYLDGPGVGLDPQYRVGWPFARILGGAKLVELPMGDLLNNLPSETWDGPSREALILPIAETGQETPAAALVLGRNPHRRDREEMIEFARLMGAQIAAALTAAQAHLREAGEAERLRQLFEQSPSFMAVLRGPEHRFEQVNLAYLQLIGHRDVVGKPIRAALPEIAGQGLYELLDSVYATGEPFKGKSMEVTLQRAPGAEPEPRFLDFVYQPIRNAEGRVTGVFVEGFDVTDVHAAAVALRESEAQFRTLAEAMLNHVWTSRPDGYLDWFNSRLYEYTGLEAGSLIGVNWAQIVHEDDLDPAQKTWALALASGEPYAADLRLRRADGVYRWHIARAVAVRGEDGEIARWIGTNTDIHEQKAATEALSNLNATLEQLVQERTNELMAAEEALRQSQKMEAVGQLTGGLAHDFNNLLAGITGSLEMLDTRVKQGRLDAVPRYLDAAQGAAKRAAALTQRLLAFSRRQTLDPRPVNVNRLVAEMEDLIRRTVGPEVVMEVVGAGGLWLTLVDPNQLENALLNLCINARDAMPDGGRLTIETANKWLDDHAAKERELAPGQYVSLCVTDTGAGMTPEVKSRAFDPFFTTKPLGQGTGLGLSMIYGFVRQSGGQVRIYSEVGRGTTMCLYLPRHAGLEAEGEKSQGLANPDFVGHGETVLVVDDEPTVRMLIVEVLQEAGYRTIEADDGASALHVLQSPTRIDLVVTDVGLPGGINGRQVADAGRALRPALKVLFITGYAENAVVGNGHLERGMQIMTKPFAVEQLGNKIREMLDMEAQDRPSGDA